MKAFTDYPIEEMGDNPFMIALIRECELITCHNNQCLIRIGSVEKLIERKFVYSDKKCNPITQGDVFH